MFQFRPAAALPCLAILWFAGNSWATMSPQSSGSGALLPQTILFGTPGPQIVGTLLSLPLSASSGLAVNYASSTTSVCTVSGNTVSSVAPGTCTITATQPGDGVTYAAATPVTQSFSVGLTGVAPALTELLAPDATSTADFGFAVAISGNGNTAVVGSSGQNSYSGAVYIFTQSAGTWNLQQEILGPSNGYFGYSVAVSQDGLTVLVGDFGTNSYTGSANVYTFDGTNWNLQQVLTATDASAFQFFGQNVALSGDGNTALISGSQAGSAYAFGRTGTNWTQQQKLTVAGTASGETFSALTLSYNGNIALIGIPNHNQTLGAAYIFTRSSAGAWSQQQELTAPDGVSGDYYGYRTTLSSDGSKALVSAANKTPGTVYAFSETGGVWIQQQELTGSGAFGSGLSISNDGNTLLVGAHGWSGLAGSAYVFRNSAGQWTQQQTIASPNESAFGSITALSGDGSTGLVGSNKGSNAGLVYLFAVPGALVNQTITFNPIAGQTAGASFTLSAAASSGLAVSYASTTSSVCTVSGNTVSLVAAGTCTITASQAGDGLTYTAASPVAQSFTVSASGVLTPQTITFPTIPSQQTGTPLTLSATASSGLPVSYSSSTTSVCTVSATTATLLTAGTCTITASQPGDGITYAAASPVAQSFTVSPGLLSQTILFGTPGPQIVGTMLSLPPTSSFGLTVSYTSSTTSVCTVSGNTVSSVAPGTCTITATQPGDGVTYAAATPVTQSFAVGVTGVAPALTELLAPDATSTADFGFAVAISGNGNTAVVGSSGQNSYSGAVYIFTQSAGTWNLQQEILAPANGGYFGYSVAISQDGTTVLVGDFGTNSLAGSANVYTFNGTSWNLQQVLTAADASPNQYFGQTVALSGDGNTALISGYQAGSAYAFGRTGTTWTQQQKFTVAGTASGETFPGLALSYNGNTALIGAWQHDSNTGAGFVFVRSSAGAWSQQQQLTASDGASGDYFGNRTALSSDGSTALVAAQSRNSGAGAIYVFGLTSGNWVQQQELTALGSNNLGSGLAVSNDGSTLLAGAFGGVGSAYLFRSSGGQWTQQQAFTAPDASSGAGFGVIAALSGDGTTGLVGAYKGGSSGAGSAYLFAVPGALVNQTITFNPIAQQTAGGSLTLSATASSGLAVSYASTTASVCTISGNTVSSVAAGTCTITASQAGDGVTYAAAAPVTQSFTVSAQLTAQTITFPTIPSQQVGTPLTLSATASSALPVTFASTLTTSNVCMVSGNIVTFSAAGVCTIAASQAGNSTYAAAPLVTQSFTVTAPLPQTITFAAPPAQQVGTPLTLTATASSGLPVSFNASPTNVCNVQLNTSTGVYTAVFSAIGSCNLTASQTGNASYSPAVSVPQTVAVSGEAQTITATPIGAQTEGTSLSLENYFAASSGLGLAFSGSGDCTVAGNIVTLGANAGTCTITASQGGDNQTYAAAANVQQTITVQPLALASSYQTIASSKCTATGVAYDSAENIYIAYAGAGCGYVTAIYANGVPTATISTATIISGLTTPAGLSIDSNGNVFIADSGAGTVVELSANGTQSVVVSGLTAPTYVTVDSTGTLLFITEPLIGTVVEASLAQSTARVRSSSGAQFVPVRFSRSARLRLVSSSNNFFPLITGLTNPGQYAQDSEGNGYVVNNAGSSASQVLKLPNAAAQTGATPASSLTSLATVPNAAGGLAPSATGVVINQNLGAGGAIVAVSLVDGSTSTLAATGANSTYLALAQNSNGSINTLTSATAAVVQTTQASAVNFGSVNVAQTQAATVTFSLGSSEILAAASPVKILGSDFSAAATTCSAGLGSAASCTVTVTFKPVTAGVRHGALQLTDSKGNVATTYIYGVGVAPVAAFDTAPQNSLYLNTGSVKGLALDGAGDLFFVDSANNQVFEIAAGASAPVALLKSPTGLSAPSGIAVDGAGNVFVADTGNNRVVLLSGGSAVTYVSSVTSISGSALNAPQGLATDGASNLYIADSGNGRVVQVSPSGTANVWASGLTAATGVALDSMGNVYVAGGGVVTVVSVSTKRTTLGSGFTQPTGVALDAAGDIYVTDASLNTVTEITPSGQTSILSSLAVPYSLVIDGAGNLFIANAGTGAQTGILQFQRSQSLPLSFAATLEGNTSADSPQTETLINIGNDNLTASALTVSANFAQVTGNAADCGAASALTPGASCNIRLSFTPAASGSLTGTVTLGDNSLNAVSATQTIQMSGTGQSPLKPQTVTFSQIAAQTAVTSLTLSATASSGLAVTYSSATPTVCSVSGGSASLLIAGTCTLTAAQSGNATYAAASSVTQSFTVNPHPQTISFGTISTQTAATTLTLTGTASSGLTVAYVSSTPTVCTVASNTATLLASGTCTLVASQGGNAAYSAATSVTQSFTVTKHSQTIAFAAIGSQVVGTPLTLAATASSGLAVSYSASPSSVCSVANGIVTLAARGTCKITASQSGNTAYTAAAAVSQSFSVLSPQTITFATIPAQTAATTLNLTASASSGLPVSYTVSTAGVCSATGSTLSLLSAGTCTVTAAQAGNASYAAAKSVTQSFTVNLHAQTITFGSIAAQTAANTLNLTAVASSGLAVTYTALTPSVCTVAGKTVSLLIAGTCTVTAAQTGNAAYSAATAVTQSFTVNKHSQTIAFGTIATQPATTKLALSATASSGLAVSFASSTPTVCTVSGSQAVLLIAGTCTITASQAGNDTYAAATSVTQSFVVTKHSQTITFASIGAQSVGTPLTLTATADSGLAVTYAASPASVCKVTGSTAVFSAAGTCAITATQTGNATYAAAAPVTRSFSVKK